MNNITVDNLESLQNVISYFQDYQIQPQSIKLQHGIYTLTLKDETFNISTDKFNKTERANLYSWIQELKKPNNTNLIYGKDRTKNIVSCEVIDSTLQIFTETDTGISTEILSHKYWILSHKAFNKNWVPLEGNLFYKYICYFDTEEEFQRTKREYYNSSIWYVNDPKESAMLLNGFTYFKGMKVKDVSILSFDIEATGLVHNENSKTLIISNTFRRNGIEEKKIFSEDEFTTPAEFLEAWCTWVREKDPSIISGFNIFGYDLPYLNFCAKEAGTSLNLGRDGSEIRFDKWQSKFRKDGSQDYLYNRSHIFGREIVDTMFVAYHFDFARKYERYALKEIIKQENLARTDRQYYDAANIGEDWKDLSKRDIIKTYAQDDADENLRLYDLMISAYFYSTPHIPKTFQAINYSATGSQVNSVLVRSYLQEGHSLPQATEAEHFPGAISDGNPGVYKNVFKVDVASLYPSVMLQYEVYDRLKDPRKNFLKMVEYFTKERLVNKKKAEETGDRYYSELEQSGKIFINSAYGLLGAKGLLFNSPKNDAMVTEKGREILKKSILWATGQEYKEKVNESPDKD